eukprot:GAHX01001257.1.p1 GENE.GAHX01001257.1~~GAHX01001257.1.p1  ORF type:complete len:689 (-),score=150.61 GAHX01001257.1:1342-3360(-)
MTNHKEPANKSPTKEHSNGFQWTTNTEASNIPEIPLNHQTIEYHNNSYCESITNPTEFFSTAANNLLYWTTSFSTPYSDSGKIYTSKWFEDGTLNACFNCVDCHVDTNKTAILAYNNDQSVTKLSYKELLDRILRVSNYFKRKGLSKGDTVCIYMPMCAEILVVSLACARLGLIHNVVFSGYSADSLITRIEDSNAKLLVTAMIGHRGSREILFYDNIQHVLKGSSIRDVLILDNGTDIKEAVSKIGDDIEVSIYSKETKDNSFIPCEPMGSEDILFYLYTSGSTGKPKGIIHSTGGYLLWAAMTIKEVFKVNKDSVFFCSADLGWITGHTYTLYGPLLMGCTTVCYGSIPYYPDYFSLFEIMDKLKVTHFYTAPTVIRLLEKEIGWDNETFNKIRNKYDISSLEGVGTVGEPINAKAYKWYSKYFGDNKIPILDTYFQTEAGGFMITPITNVTEFIPECAGIPFYGMKPEILKKEEDKIIKCETNELGVLGFKNSWPGLCKSILNDNGRFIKSYFTDFEGYYTTGDEGYVDNKGYFWIRGRIDDIINVSGHKISTAELESVVSNLEFVVESAALGIKDEITGESIYIFAVFNNVKIEDEQAKKKIVEETLKTKIGRIIRVKKSYVVKDLPKTRTGKIMRRVMKKLVEKEDVGDVSTCSNPDSIKYITEMLK